MAVANLCRNIGCYAKKGISQARSLRAGLIALYSFSRNDGDELYDVVIVGAGLSGLTAARRLAEANKKILVLEAQDRVGGRTWSQPVGEKDFIDIGGQWTGKGHDAMYRLVAEAGLKTFPTFTNGKSILRKDAENKTYNGDTPPLGLFALLATQKALNRFDKAASLLSLEAPCRPQMRLRWIKTTEVQQCAYSLHKSARCRQATKRKATSRQKIKTMSA